MPRMSLCPQPGCRTLTEGGRCPRHKTQASRDDTERRGTSSQRGYGSKWRSASRGYLAHHPLCVECQRKGTATLARHVDHITPWKTGKTDEERRALFWDKRNWRALCASCHGRIGAKAGTRLVQPNESRPVDPKQGVGSETSL
jgi:5-methylcytosine-specific restriction enzyme A